MSNELNFETYLFIDNKKLKICVIRKLTFEKIYSDEVISNNYSNDFKFEKIYEFLEKNIFKIEKILKNFIKNIYIILRSDEFFSVKLSIKSNNNGNIINPNSLLHPLNDLKNLFKSNFPDEKIIHMLIENYTIDNKNYSSLPKGLNCDFYSLDVKFICLPKNSIEDLELILKKYHIVINKIVCSSYIEEFIDDDQVNLFSTASRIISGSNNNEILLVDKTFKNKGFFEKFFDFFN